MKLEDLCGVHELSGVDFGTKPRGESYYDSDPNTMTFVFDGLTYVASENPSDGYRSMLEDIEQTDVPVTNKFSPCKVVCFMRTAARVGEYGCDEILMVDATNGNIVLRLGTSNSDDYYPSYTAEFTPENMSVNSSS